MLQEIVSATVMLIPVFFLLAMMFAAGFVIGRMSRQDGR